jgi:hypothetical protein
MNATTTAIAKVENVDAEETLSFSIREGRIHNEFYRKGPVAAHLVLTSGLQPRLVTAFPAGNSGVSLWCLPGAEDVEWGAVEHLYDLTETEVGDQPRRGISADLQLQGEGLTISRAVLGSVRSIRDFMHTQELPEALDCQWQVVGNQVIWQRHRIDGQCSYKLAITVTIGTIRETQEGNLQLESEQGMLKFRLVALTGEPPLTPIDLPQLLNDKAIGSITSRKILSFLTYEEKMLAGSWQYLTYFGRDTLMSVRLLMPVLTTPAIEAALGAVLERIADDGQIAHEEDIGEFAVLHRRDDTSADPIYDYNMVDDNFMLAPVIAHYLLDHPGGMKRRQMFLSKRDQCGRSYQELLIRNLEFVVESSKQFAKEPGIQHLIALKDNYPVGEWRDSHEGLGWGRIAYNVNGVFVPAALTAVARLIKTPELSEAKSKLPASEHILEQGQTWQQQAPTFFEAKVCAQSAMRRQSEFAKTLGVPVVESISEEAELRYYAIALHDDGSQVPVLNSDFGFEMLFGSPSADVLEAVVYTLMQPFPMGLVSPVGLMVANPVLGDQELRDIFTAGHYHGTVIWSWQQALFVAGLQQQLNRCDLPEKTLACLREAQRRVWKVIRASRHMQNSELWSWSCDNGSYQTQPFGQREEDVTESNAAQLWSTVFLGLDCP